MTYKRMTEADRRQIHRWRQEGHGLREGTSCPAISMVAVWMSSKRVIRLAIQRWGWQWQKRH